MQTSPTNMERVTVKAIRDSAVRIAIRLDLGEFQIRGPLDNVLEMESRVAWATVATELQNEGYGMVQPEEYAATYGVALAEVMAMIEQNGLLFALRYRTKEEDQLLVPLAEHELRADLGAIPE